MRGRAETRPGGAQIARLSDAWRFPVGQECRGLTVALWGIFEKHHLEGGGVADRDGHPKGNSQEHHHPLEGGGRRG